MCCAVVGGVPPSALPVAALDFYAAFFRHVFATCVALEKRGVLPSPAAVAKLMREAGAIGPIEEEIHRLVAVTPYYTVKRLQGQAEVIVEMRRRRELLALLARLDAALRTGSIDSTKALEVLGRNGRGAQREVGCELQSVAW